MRRVFLVPLVQFRSCHYTEKACHFCDYNVIVRVPSRIMRKFVCKLWLNEVSQQ